MSSEREIYDEYWKHGNHQGWRASAEDSLLESEREAFGAFAKEGTLVVDYGCGPADRYSGFIERLGARYRGFDISETAVKEGRLSGKDSNLLTMEGLTNCREGEADVVLCMEVLEHLMKPSRAVAELARITKPGGHLILSVPNGGVWMARLEFLLTGFLCPNGMPKTCRSEPWDDPHIRFFTPTTLARLVAGSGFDILRLTSANPFTLASLPYFYRIPPAAKFLNLISKPCGWLSKVRPSLFATRLLLVARRSG